MHPDFRVDTEAEFAHYNRHQNNPNDCRYRNFLNKLWNPVKQELHPDAKGLDYGSGPGPTLYLMAQEDGFQCEHYDPYFHPTPSALEKQYDFITCSETAEHFYDPHHEFTKLSQMLLPGGCLGIMTTRYKRETDFQNWHYRHDPTHVTFYSDQTFVIITERFGFDQVSFISNSVILLRKPINNKT
jgi:hypothetical protein